MEHQKRNGWVISRELTLKEEELLFITAQSAGVKIFYRTLQRLDKEEYPYISYDGHEILSANDKVFWCGIRMEVTYEQVMERLTEQIKTKAVFD